MTAGRIDILPSSVQSSTQAMSASAAKHTNLGFELRKLDTAGVPDDLSFRVVNAALSAAAVLNDNAAALYGHAKELEDRLHRFLKLEQAHWSTDVVDSALTVNEFRAYAAAKGINTFDLTLMQRADLFATYLQETPTGRGSAAAHASLTSMLEVTGRPGKIALTFRTHYREAVAIVIRDADGRITVDALERAVERVSTVHVKIPKLPDIPRWVKFGKLLPAVGVALDAYVGYQQSSASSTSGRLLSGANNAAANAIIDLTPGVNIGYAVWDIGATVSGNSGYQASSVPLVEADAQVLARLNDLQALVRLFHRIKNKEHGVGPYRVYRGWKLEDYVNHHLQGARRPPVKLSDLT